MKKSKNKNLLKALFSTIIYIIIFSLLRKYKNIAIDPLLLGLTSLAFFLMTYGFNAFADKYGF